MNEVLLVATDPGGEPVGVSTAYLQRNEQLRMDLWHYRAFVASGHRMTNVAQILARDGRDELQQRFVTGRDARAGGILYEVENEAVKRHAPYALWRRLDFLFIGENARGDHVRVHYFPGALGARPTALMAHAQRRTRAPSRFERPIFIVASPHPATSPLFAALSRLAEHVDPWGRRRPSDRGNPGAASRQPRLGQQPARRPGRLGLRDRAPRETGLLGHARDREGRTLDDKAGLVRLLDANPKNSLRVPFLNACFPDALFLYLHREPEESLASLHRGLGVGDRGDLPRAARLGGAAVEPWR